MSGIPSAPSQGLPPLIMTAQGPLPQTPISINGQLINLVSQTVPDYTANLPGSLIDDISGTDTGAIVLIDQARVETINSLTPYGANAFVLNALGQVYGVPLGLGSNATVNVVFSSSNAIGYTINQGFVVGDGVNQYQLLQGTIIGASGSSPPVTALATTPGTFAIPPGTVTNLITSVPIQYTITVTNPLAGTPFTSPQTIQSYRAQVLQAGRAASQGMPSYVKTLLSNVSGVNPLLISIQAQAGGGWKMIVGGGDLYQVALAIFEANFDVSLLVGSTMSVQSYTLANPGVVTTSINHGFANGAHATIAGSNPTSYNITNGTVTVISPNQFSIGVNSSGFAAYVGGGVVTPNNRNAIATIVQYPDSYNIPIVLPPSQTVVLAITWNTNLSNFTGVAAVAQLGNPALVNYINTIPVTAPINLGVLESVFRTAVASVLPSANLTRFVCAVSVNGIGVSPVSGTEEILSDVESFWSTAASGTGITITQG